MTGINLYQTQQAYKAYLKTAIPFRVESGQIPDAENLQLVNGALAPYVVLRFSDMFPRSGGGSFGGALHGEYYTYVDALCVAPSDDEARELASLVNSKSIGKRFANTGELNTQFGGGTYAIPSGERIPAAIVARVSFQYAINIEGVGNVYPN